MNEEELKDLTAKIYDQIVSDAEALATKYDEYRNLISEKIVALSVTMKKYDSLFNDYLKPFCTDRLDVYFCVFCMHYEIFYKQVAVIYGDDNCIKMLNGKSTPEGDLHDDIKII
jgi:hypothetical protein